MYRAEQDRKDRARSAEHACGEERIEIDSLFCINAKISGGHKNFLVEIHFVNLAGIFYFGFIFQFRNFINELDRLSNPLLPLPNPSPPPISNFARKSSAQYNDNGAQHTAPQTRSPSGLSGPSQPLGGREG